MKKIYSVFFMTVFALFAKAQAPVLLSIEGSTAVCAAPGPSYGYTAMATNSPTSYNWAITPSAGVIITGSGDFRNVVFPNSNLTYTINSVAANASGLSNVGVIIVTVFETPTITFSGNNTICQGSGTSIMASSTILYSASSSMSYNWAPSAGLNTTSGPVVIATPTATTIYSVTLMLGNCVRTYQRTVLVTQCVGIETFSSNTDDAISAYPNPSNGTFIVKSTRNEKVLIVNDLGQLVRDLTLVTNEELEIRDLEPGMYFLISSNSKKKIIITR